jgi:DNA modification methylase
MKEEGINVPALPCNFIRCANRKEAKKMILALTSQYGNMTEDGLYEFLEESGIGFEEMRDCFNFPEINMDDFGAGYYGDDDKGNDDGFEMPDHESIETDIKLGDLFEIGPHRLLCGDSTDPDQVARLMNGEKAVLCNTDPPYGINFVKLSQSKGQSKGYNDIENDDFKAGEFQEFLEKSIKASLQHLTDNCAFYFWHPMLTQGYFAAAAADIIIHRQIIWVKPTFIFGRGDYHWRHELCFYGWVKGHRPNFYGERNQNTIWEFARENDKIHPTQKPVKIFEIPIQNHTLKGQIVYEPFTGSGSQYVAAHQLKRKCYGMEIDPKYCQVIIDRMIRLDDTLEIKKNGVPYQRESMAS